MYIFILRLFLKLINKYNTETTYEPYSSNQKLQFK